jgi:hypothetical protein
LTNYNSDRAAPWSDVGRPLLIVGEDMMYRCLPWILVMMATTLNGAHALASNAPIGATEIEQQALAFLKSLPREWSRSSSRDCKTYEDKNIDALAASFAISAANFLQAFTRQYGAITITSAHRTQQEQVCVCIGENGPCAGKPHVVKRRNGARTVVRGISRHQLGVALDVRPGNGSAQEFANLHNFARLNPQFGVHFPLGRRDYPHMEPRSQETATKFAWRAPNRRQTQ